MEYVARNVAVQLLQFTTVGFCDRFVVSSFS